MRGIANKPATRDEAADDLEQAEDVSKDEVEEEWEKGIPPFVRKLTKMVSENPIAIDWTPSGSFIVKEIDNFGSTLLPKYFKSIKFCSFVRQLNMYNFHKVEDHPHNANKSMEFKNPYFLPGRKDLLKKIHRRKTVKRAKEEDPDDDKRSPKELHSSPSSSGPSTPSPLTPASPAQNLNLSGTASVPVPDGDSYKGLLHAVLKIQQQVELNQLALKSVVDELNYFRKSHYDLEQKISNIHVPQAHVQSPISNIYAYATNAFASNPPYTSQAQATTFTPLPASHFAAPPMPAGVQYATVGNPMHTSTTTLTSVPMYTTSAQNSQNAGFVFNSPTDINAFLFSDDTAVTNSSSPPATNANSASRGNLLSLMQSGDGKAFEFTSVLQADADPSTPIPSTPGSASTTTTTTAPTTINLYDNNHFDVF